MNVIIFGGAGFIGTNMTKRCLERGDRVLCIDNFYTGNNDNIKQFISNNNFKFIYLDITDMKLLFNVIELNANIFFDGVVDEIYNFACPASPPKYQKDPIYTIHCSLAVEYLCKLSIKYNSILLHASTSEVYGDPLMHPQNESYKGNVNTVGPRSCYDEGKRIAETIIYEYHKQGLKCKIIRIFNTYGPYMDPNDGRVISNFINQALDNKDIIIYGDGNQTRSFQYIDDLLDGIDKVMHNTNKDFYGPVNIGSEYEFTINDLAKLVLEMIPESKSKTVYNDLPQDDPIQRKADNAKLFSYTKHKSNITLEIGLRKTIDYFKEIRK